jgi:hemoglobin-like flavoprotein
VTPKQIDLVQQTFAKVVPIADVAANLFYARLFEINPGLRPLFKGDMKRQGAMLMSMLASAVRGLTDPHALIPVLTALGRRHAGYGVTEAHFEMVAEALLGTLAQALDEDFTPEVREAWTATYWMMADVMMAGARQALSEPVALAA